MWTYARIGKLEVSLPDRDRAVILKPHLHTNVQILFVTSGERRVIVGTQEVVVCGGSSLIIPGGVPHHALDDSRSSWSGLNLYVRPSLLPELRPRVVVVDGDFAWTNHLRNHACLPIDLVGTVRSLIAQGRQIWVGEARAIPPDFDIVLPGEPLVRRETRIRRFKRLAGIAPGAHAQAIRLDRARHLLGGGHPPIDVAHALNFADQSHLGRQFKAAFGTTPARYAAAMIETSAAHRSQSFQTEGATRK